MNNLINYSELSRLLTGDRTAIRSDYKGKKYARKINRLKWLIELWVRWQEKQKYPLAIAVRITQILLESFLACEKTQEKIQV